MALPVLLISIALSTLASTLAGALALRLLGIGVLRVDLGVWAPKVRFAAAGCDFSLSPWMLSGSSIVKDVGNVHLYGDRPGKLFGSLGRPARALLALVSPLAMLAIACLFAGKKAFFAFGSGFEQIVVGTLHPLSDAQAYLSAFDNLASESPVSAVGIAMAKFAAFTLLPVPPLAGGRALVELCRPRDSGHGRMVAVAQNIGILAWLFIAAMWLVAACRWVIDGGAI